MQRARLVVGGSKTEAHYCFAIIYYCSSSTDPLCIESWSHERELWTMKLTCDCSQWSCKKNFTCSHFEPYPVGCTKIMQDISRVLGLVRIDRICQRHPDFLVNDHDRRSKGYCIYKVNFIAKFCKEFYTDQKEACLFSLQWVISYLSHWWQMCFKEYTLVYTIVAMATFSC